MVGILVSDTLNLSDAGVAGIPALAPPVLARTMGPIMARTEAAAQDAIPLLAELGVESHVEGSTIKWAWWYADTDDLAEDIARILKENRIIF